jgi:hypothetical protein
MSGYQDVVDRIRAEYLEMPGMKLRVEQVQRLCGVDRTVCELVLDALVGTKFLCIKRDGTYARLTEDVHRRAIGGPRDLNFASSAQPFRRAG